MGPARAGTAGFIAATLVAASVRNADQGERTVGLRLGEFTELKGPGLFFLLPVLEKVAYWINNQVITTSFKAGKTLTKDTVPVDGEAVLFKESARPEEGSTRGRGLPLCHQLGVTNRSAGGDRQVVPL